MTPKSILIIRPDTLGDLVVFAPGLKALRQGLPDCRIRVLARSAYLSLTPLMPGNAEWFGFDFNPFSQGPEEVWDQLQGIVDKLRGEAPDLVIAPCRRTSWLERAVTAAFPQAESLSLGEAEDPYFTGALQRRLGAKDLPPFTHSLKIPETLPDWKTGELIASFLGLDSRQVGRPELTIEKTLQESASSTLARLGLEPGRYAVCAPAGHANVSIKTWPAERFALTARHLKEKHGVDTLLVGSTPESGYLEAVRITAEDCTRVWTGAPAELPLLAALCSQARLYYGNDTGTMHLAAALSIPVAGVFGGGTWPRFVPAANLFAALVNPMPCFGCGWDCCFGDAPCVKAISSEDLCLALDRLLAGEGPGTIKLLHISEDAIELAEKSSVVLRARTQAMEGRQQEFERTVALAKVRDTEILTKEKEINAKEAEINTKEREIHAKETEIHSKEREINAKEAEIHSKQEEIQALHRSCEERAQALLLKDAEIQGLKQACDERLALINRLNDDIRRLQEAVGTLSTQLAEATNQASEAKTQATAVETRYARLAPDAGAWAGQLEAAGKRTTELVEERTRSHARIQQLETELAERDARLANIQAGLGTLELHRHYQRQLREKEDVLQSLHRACVEREKLIRRLTLGEQSTLNRLAEGASGWWEARVAAPLSLRWNEWLLRGHWMQLGELRQHEPRPLAWERGLSRKARIGSAVPKIGLVTPSYNQAAYLKRTLESVLGQAYPGLLYVVQDGGSKDNSAELIRAQESRLHAWESKRDAGQADAIRQGFAKLEASLGPDDLMAWLNSDDLLAPGALARVGRYFAEHPEVDALYGHRIIIDAEDREIGRWILPPHEPDSLRWVDLVPQETLFWRKRAWDKVGGLDPSFHFALDWDFLIRLQEAGLTLVRIPHFLGAFRVHEDSKTHSLIHKRGREEMELILSRTHGAGLDRSALDRAVTRMKARGALSSRLLALGLKF